MLDGPWRGWVGRGQGPGPGGAILSSGPHEVKRDHGRGENRFEVLTDYHASPPKEWIRATSKVSMSPQIRAIRRCIAAMA